MKATISLGSNLGDRFQYLQNALDSINEVTGTQVNQEGITAQITNRITGESRIGSRGNTFAGDDAE